MYESFNEQKYNSLSPKHTAKAAQCICKAAYHIGGIEIQIRGKEKIVYLFAPFASSNPLTVCNSFTRVSRRWKPPAACAVDFFAVAMKEVVVQVSKYYAGRMKYSYQKDCHEFPQFAYYPSGIPEKAMTGTASFPPSWFCERQGADNNISCGSGYPSGYGIEKNFCCWNREYLKKISDYIRSYRDSISVYTSLPFLCFLRISPEDWYVSDNSSSKLAA